MAKILENNENSGEWVLWAFISFFAVFCFVDIYFVYTAIRTHTGLVTDNSYYKGLDYNDTLNLAKMQKESGTTSHAEVKDGFLIFELKDKTGAPITDATVISNLMIPTHDGFDFKLPLIESNPGIYKAALNLPKKGLWDAQIEAQWTQQSYKTILTLTAQ